ncbi:aldo/keto reductase [Enterococcus sp. BWR-S5]|uniref:aldo/keto reductase n=1 Tax=Enterococcus sp. BWR-S5 TaxID=2787714 RepID=UPI001924130A|nr:aldo/keto reductase [Enterococcus sp. BWR-S5]MBL1225459.1 aldo/keto reductase [Enterococcus sp. BWR-S5]
MKTTTIGSSLTVSRIGLGAINFGTKVSEEAAFSLLSEYTQLGGNFIDTANNYAQWNGGDGGESERTIGMWLTQSSNREKMVIATKLGARNTGAGKGFSDMEGLSRETILRSVERSLNHLQTTIDLLYLHVDDFNTPQEETMSTLSELVKQGVVKELGCSNFYSWRIERARQICQEFDWPFFSAIQQRYSYLSPVMDADLFPQIALNADMKSYLTEHPELRLVAYSPLLKGQYNTSEIINPAYDTAENRQKLEQLLAMEKQPNRWVLDYITDQFRGSVALVTTSSVQHLREAMRSSME